MSTIQVNRHPSRYGFGFDQFMATADFDRFPAWYVERCLLPKGVKHPLPAIETAEPPVELYTFSRQAA